jgi:hypothetical protein
VNARDDAAGTVLHRAAAAGASAAAVCLLLKAGADVHALNSAGKTCAQVAADSGHAMTQALLARALRARHTATGESTSTTGSSATDVKPDAVKADVVSTATTGGAGGAATISADTDTE